MVVNLSGMTLFLQAKLISVPVTPAIVAIFFFIIGLVLFLVFQYDTYSSWASWL
jgi:putative effector of murein hydrolase